MQETTANDFYERITGGTDSYETITLEHSSGASLDDVQMHPVDKKVLASVIERLPEEMFDAVEEAEDAEQAEDELEDKGMSISAVTASTVGAFEDLVAESLSHPDLTNVQVRHIVNKLSFNVLFRLGTEIINLSFEQSDEVKDFHGLE